MNKSKWTKSSRCESNGCIEVRHSLATGTVSVRGTTALNQVLVFTEEEWRDFIAGAKAGDFDL